MNKRTSNWDYSSIKNFPEGATIQRNGEALIVIRRKTIYDPTIGRGKDASREYLGRVVDGVFYSRDEYRLKFQKGGKPRRVPLIPHVSTLGVPEAFKSLSDDELKQLLIAETVDVPVSCVPILHRIALELNIIEDLQASFGNAAADAIFTIAAFHICTGDNSARAFEHWARNRLLPESIDLKDGRDLSNLYEQIGTNLENVHRYTACRIARNKQAKLLLSVDSTTIACGCSNSAKAKIGKNKRGQIESQINLAVTFNTTTHQPILYRVLPGNINDCQTVLELLTSFDEYNVNIPECAASLDRGYFSEENLLIAYKAKVKCIFAAKINIGWIAESIDRVRTKFVDAKKGTGNHAYALKDGSCLGLTIERRIKVNGTLFAVYVHVFKSERTASYQLERFYSELNKFENLWISKGKLTKRLRKESIMKYFIVDDGDGSCVPKLIRDKKAIDDAVKNFGIFVDVTTWRCSAQECYEFYGFRRDIERIFRTGKSDCNMNVQRTHNDRTMEGKCFVNFIELSILEELKQRLATDQMKVLKSGKTRVELAKHTFDIDDVINGLDSVAYTRRKSNGALITREVVEKQREIAIACGCRGIFDMPYTY
ncbi:transposase [Anaerobiospirillum sp. NML120448]|uniref:IS1634 family transposase n=1 Tax=Anaerobiospirillum sp. NML120448 TaxID=2932816 RepID=UPI001FF3AE3B|nr:transposase [Anaerobiospirillum sp. NML120448]MCK0515591.1 transposase [Anaerobiospirillum sp. NML120448]